MSSIPSPLSPDHIRNSNEIGAYEEAESSISVIHQDSWLLIFIDILTLLLTLFVLLLAYKNDGPEEKSTQVPVVQQQAVQDTAVNNVMVSATSIPGIEFLLPIQFPAVESDPVPVLLSDQMSTNQTLTSQTTPDTDFAGLLKHPNLPKQLEVNTQQHAVNLEVNDSILFRPASAALTEDGIKLLGELATILLEYPYEISVEGHTDNIPIHTAQFSSNWDLSAARATIVTRKLIEQGLPAGRIRAIGYGETRPRADNRTPEGRTRNRRVSFVLHSSDNASIRVPVNN